ncbi:MAG: Glu/Leu/Phe/Val dehydrogenase dimerization domain-containing protein [Thermodesulfobacteriota bacterium]|nr:Glu/Leu/Phe/Val dehydrogenase dimerization domain-containing protein [Thermodesulfobacteriota bacterium]
MGDILGREPELVVEYTDPLEGFKGWLAIDALSHKLCAGGLRVQKGLTRDCVVSLARNMTLKMRIAGIRADGAKSGIDYDPHSPGKTGALHRFIRSIRPLILERYSMGPDLNVKLKELDSIAKKLDIPSVKVAIAKAQGFDLPYFLERYGLLGEPVEYATVGRLRSGFGLAAACMGVLEFLGIPNEEATVAIQGFGGLGGAAAYSLQKAGVKVIGIADEEKSLVCNNEHALDIKALVEHSVDGLIPNGWKNGGQLDDRSRIFDVECDVFIPAAIENAIVQDNARTISTKAIVPGANLAVTEEAERLLNDRGIITIPDFMAGCGGSMSMKALFGPKSHPTVSDVLDGLAEGMHGMVKKVLERSQKDGTTPREAALDLCSEAPIYPDAKPYGPSEQ